MSLLYIYVPKTRLKRKQKILLVKGVIIGKGKNMSVKLEVATAVHLTTVYKSVTATLSRALCNRFVFIQEKMFILQKYQFHAQSNCTVVLHNSQLRIAGMILYDRPFMKFISSLFTYLTA